LLARRRSDEERGHNSEERELHHERQSNDDNRGEKCQSRPFFCIFFDREKILRSDEMLMMLLPEEISYP
jgi:hypothetical protein